MKNELTDKLEEILKEKTKQSEKERKEIEEHQSQRHLRGVSQNEEIYIV